MLHTHTIPIVYSKPRNSQRYSSPLEKENGNSAGHANLLKLVVTKRRKNGGRRGDHLLATISKYVNCQEVSRVRRLNEPTQDECMVVGGIKKEKGNKKEREGGGGRRKISKSVGACL